MRHYCLAGLLALSLIPAVFFSPAAAAGGEETQVNNGQDITQPLTRFDLRYGYQQTPLAPQGNRDRHVATLRVDKPFAISSEWLLATRVDLPFMFTNLRHPMDNRRGDMHFGLSDALVQALLVYVPNKTFAFASGTQVIFPTASEKTMGAGKYRVVPTAAVRIGTESMLRGSWVALVARWDKDFAESYAKSRKVNELQFAPVVNIWLPGYWFINLFPSPDIRYNLGDKRRGDSGRWFVPANFMLGKMLSKNVVSSIEVGIPIVNDYRVYDFKLEARLGFLF